ncbi:MAG: peptide deformylase [Puniceicoccales bacterium]|nr:peptide deformylase [Puniceicoccales bacterium]
MDYKISGEIHLIGAPILRTVGIPIVDFSPELGIFFGQMDRIMRADQGIGIAAQQVGLAVRCCIVDVSECAAEGKDFCILNGNPVAPQAIMPLYICNPKIVAAEHLCTLREGCLSIPHFRYEIERPETITVFFSDPKGNAQKITCNGVLARCMQHEFDHLDGKLFIDWLSPSGEKKFKRFLKNRE